MPSATWRSAIFRLAALCAALAARHGIAGCGDYVEHGTGDRPHPAIPAEAAALAQPADRELPDRCASGHCERPEIPPFSPPGSDSQPDRECLLARMAWGLMPGRDSRPADILSLSFACGDWPRVDHPPRP